MNLQGTEGWLLDKCGHASASEFSSVLAKGQGKTRAAYLRKVVTERLTGRPLESRAYGSWAANLDRGHEHEPLARLAYEVLTGEPVEQVGFLKHATLKAGCSPDGLIGKDGGLEAKCVIPTVQLETILGKDYPSEHRAQVQGNLWITERDWWDFVSYSPDFRQAHLQLYKFRVFRDEAYIANLEREVSAFLGEVDALCDRLLRMSMSLEEQLQASVEEVAA